jgi:cytoskeletal protein CcmA (bactofilin family)
MLRNNKPAQPILPACTYVAERSELQGDLFVEGDLRVDGIIHGNVEVRGDMEISINGLVEGAELRARNLIVNGVVKAQIVVEEKLTLGQTARLEGDVLTNSLDIAPGALYIGSIETGDVRGSLPIVGQMPELAATGDDSYSNGNGLNYPMFP